MHIMTNNPIGASGDLVINEMNVWAIRVRAGQTVGAQTTGTNDVDLYMRFDDCPTYSEWDARGYTTSGVEN